MKQLLDSKTYYNNNKKNVKFLINTGCGVEVGEGGGFSWGGVEGWGEKAYNCN